jgi:hypothetical protein
MLTLTFTYLRMLGRPASLLIMRSHRLYGMRIFQTASSRNRPSHRGKHHAWYCTGATGCARQGEFSLFNLFLEHGFPYPSPCVSKPVLELFLVDPSLLHEHGLILRRGIGMGKVLRRKQPRLECCDSSSGQLSTGLVPSLGTSYIDIIVVFFIVFVVLIRHGVLCWHAVKVYFLFEFGVS